MNKLLASAFYTIEVGKGRSLVRLIPLVIVVLSIIAAYDLRIFKGFNDQQSMDNAQLARQIARHQGYQTYFIRPYALAQVAAFAASKGKHELFPSSAYPAGTARSIPDTYNSPGFPTLLSWYYRILKVDFEEPTESISSAHYFAGDRWVPFPNQIFILLTSLTMFLMARRLFDERVAWMSSVVLLFSDIVWKYSLLATPVSLLMLLMTLLLFGLVEVYRLGEEPLEEGDKPTLGWGWLIVPGLAVLFGLMCLLSLPLLILTVPLVIYLLLLPRTNWFLLPIFVGIVALLDAPWFFHWYLACGNAFGSNLSLGLWGSNGYAGNQVFCSLSIPPWDTMAGASGAKEYTGFLWYFQRGWDLFGSNPLVLLFAVSLLHEFRRKRVQSFRWLVLALILVTIFMTNLANAQPDPVSEWNLAVLLLPAMTMIGCAFFFVLLDRMVTQLRLLTVVLVVTVLVLCILPLFRVLGLSSSGYYNYPPYLPPYLSYLTHLAPAEEWVTTDMPWATAWYGDRPSLWLPDSVADFNSIYDTYVESEFILVTPVTLSKPTSTLTSGELKDWLQPFVLGTVPDTFPLRHVIKLPGGGPEYSIISNRFDSAAH